MFSVLLPTIPSQDVSQSLQVRLPTLRGISIPPLESEHRSSPPARISSTFVDRIDTEQRRQVARSSGHRHSRSLDMSVTHHLPAKNPLDSATSDSFILPWLNQHDDYTESPSPPLTGIYISQSSRNNSCTGVTGNLGPEGVSDLSRCTPSNLSSLNFESEESGELEEDTESESVWDLIPYDISWGPAYYGYKAGTLPGPEGKCIFLRSPTPLKYQRTGQACEKCRERKAKCSGSRPSCIRCNMRGLVCVYASDSKQDKSEGPRSVGEICAGINTAHSQTSAPTTARIRRNTDCGSHTTCVKIPSRSVALRRRHSTIGSSQSASHATGELGPDTWGEHEQAKIAVEGSKDGNVPSYGFLGALLDPLITCDDHTVSESNHASYRALAPPHTHSFLSSPMIDVVGCEKDDSSSCDLQTLRRDVKTWNHLTYACDSFFADTANANNHLSLDDKDDLTVPISPPITSEIFNATNAPLDQDISRTGMSLEGYWYDELISTKVAAVGLPMDVDTPYIALPSHAPDFYEFDQNEAIRAWFPASDCC